MRAMNRMILLIMNLFKLISISSYDLKAHEPLKPFFLYIYIYNHLASDWVIVSDLQNSYIFLGHIALTSLRPDIVIFRTL